MFARYFNLPIFQRGAVVSPALVSQSRSWYPDDGGPPDYDAVNYVPCDTFRGSLLSYNAPAVASPPTRRVHHQEKWRIAWPIEDPKVESNWYFFHMRWRIGIWHFTPSDLPTTATAPVSVSLDKHEYWWQFGITDRPAGFNPRDMSTWVPANYNAGDAATWPGTPWTETPVPPDPPDLTQTSTTGLVAVWPHQAKLAKTPAPLRFVAGWSDAMEGLIPGGRSPVFDHPRLGNKTVV